MRQKLLVGPILYDWLKDHGIDMDGFELLNLIPTGEANGQQQRPEGHRGETEGQGESRPQSPETVEDRIKAFDRWAAEE